ncbi:4Fe-4S ferredoxin iron-sulfur binding domain protein [Paramagnetospirillum magnetotacticum MS-1]|uniref:4Fe-4S ferredoxin iron-sulfur binding domain protein n=1 Tax=Paramagnetospirillum magnetotacticum MS-1 TaxID=272627 RepID=A0A0C2YI61_PARME|nr:4Fe-4S binding protein [Paramagnetospirillum magnetotacticum]KIL99434.1 4Fe-4S ferredoxin iron-sulfur binding domain protein [Paramagnetospirillum magnetotacticum MS-1]
MSRLKAAVDGVNFNRFRFWLQAFFFVLVIYGGYLGIELGNSLPMLSCGYNNEGRIGMCFLMPLQHELGWTWAKLFSWAITSLLTTFAVFVLWFVAINKGWCGFVCPLGTLQDWMTALRRRLGIRYSRYTLGQFKQLTRIKYVLLALAVLIPLGVGGGWFHNDMKLPFCSICPGKMIIPLLTGNTQYFTVDFSTKTAMVMSALGMLTTGLFFVGSFVKKRFWCFYCPMSALHYLFSKLAVLRLVKDGGKCTRCGDCYRVCDMEIKEIADDIRVGDIMMDDCTLCLKCVAACPETGALKANFAGRAIFEATEAGFIKRMNKGCKA